MVSAEQNFLNPLSLSTPMFALKLKDQEEYHPCYVIVANMEIEAGTQYPCAQALLNRDMLPAASESTEFVEVNLVDHIDKLERNYAVSLKKVSLRRDVLVLLCAGDAFGDLKQTPFLCVPAFFSLFCATDEGPREVFSAVYAE